MDNSNELTDLQKYHESLVQQYIYDLKEQLIFQESALKFSEDEKDKNLLDPEEIENIKVQESLLKQTLNEIETALQNVIAVPTLKLKIVEGILEKLQGKLDCLYVDKQTGKLIIKKPEPYIASATPTLFGLVLQAWAALTAGITAANKLSTSADTSNTVAPNNMNNKVISHTAYNKIADNIMLPATTSDRRESVQVRNNLRGKEYKKLAPEAEIDEQGRIVSPDQGDNKVRHQYIIEMPSADNNRRSLQAALPNTQKIFEFNGPDEHGRALSSDDGDAEPFELHLAHLTEDEYIIAQKNGNFQIEPDRKIELLQPIEYANADTYRELHESRKLNAKKTGEGQLESHVDAWGRRVIILPGGYNFWHLDLVGDGTLNNKFVSKYTAKGIDVYVFDTGSALPEQTATCVSFVPDGCYDIYSRHGSHVLSTIKQIAPDAITHMMRVFANGGARTSLSIIMTAFNHVINKENPGIMQFSLAGGSGSSAWRKAIEAAAHKGFYVSASASNSGRDGKDTALKFDPASVASKSKRAASIGAFAKDLTRSDFGPYGKGVDFSYPGTSIKALVAPFENDYLSGTSMSAPMHAAIAALYLDSGVAVGKLNEKMRQLSIKIGPAYIENLSDLENRRMPLAPDAITGRWKQPWNIQSYLRKAEFLNWLPLVLGEQALKAGESISIEFSATFNKIPANIDIALSNYMHPAGLNAGRSYEQPAENLYTEVLQVKALNKETKLKISIKNKNDQYCLISITDSKGNTIEEREIYSQGNKLCKDPDSLLNFLSLTTTDNQVNYRITALSAPGAAIPGSTQSPTTVMATEQPTASASTLKPTVQPTSQPSATSPPSDGGLTNRSFISTKDNSWNFNNKYTPVGNEKEVSIQFSPPTNYQEAKVILRFTNPDKSDRLLVHISHNTISFTGERANSPDIAFDKSLLSSALSSMFTSKNRAIITVKFKADNTIGVMVKNSIITKAQEILTIKNPPSSWPKEFWVTANRPGCSVKYGNVAPEPTYFDKALEHIEGIKIDTGSDVRRGFGLIILERQRKLANEKLQEVLTYGLDFYRNKLLQNFLNGSVSVDFIKNSPLISHITAMMQPGGGLAAYKGHLKFITSLIALDNLAKDTKGGFKSEFIRLIDNLYEDVKSKLADAILLYVEKNASLDALISQYPGASAIESKLSEYNSRIIKNTIPNILRETYLAADIIVKTNKPTSEVSEAFRKEMQKMYDDADEKQFEADLGFINDLTNDPPENTKDTLTLIAAAVGGSAALLGLIYAYRKIKQCNAPAQGKGSETTPQCIKDLIAKLACLWENRSAGQNDNAPPSEGWIRWACHAICQEAAQTTQPEAKRSNVTSLSSNVSGFTYYDKLQITPGIVEKMKKQLPLSQENKSGDSNKNTGNNKTGTGFTKAGTKIQGQEVKALVAVFNGNNSTTKATNQGLHGNKDASDSNNSTNLPPKKR